MKKGKRDEIISETKKPIYKKWWFWLIVAVVLIGAVGGNSNSKNETKNETKTEASSENVKKSSDDKAEKEKEAKEAAEKEAKEAALKAANEKAAQEAAAKAAAEKAAQDAADKDPNTYQSLPYDEMARNGDNHKGEKLQINGKVIQVIDSDDGTAQLRVATRDGYDDVYYIEIPASQWKTHRLLEDDVITFYGNVYGLLSYDSTMGGKITVPAMTVNMY